MYAAYRREHGRLEFAVLQLLARLVLRGLVLAMVTVPATIADVPLGDLSLTF
jgi:hypothetical protein